MKMMFANFFITLMVTILFGINNDDLVKCSSSVSEQDVKNEALSNYQEGHQLSNEVRYQSPHENVFVVKGKSKSLPAEQDDSSEMWTVFSNTEKVASVVLAKTKGEVRKEFDPIVVSVENAENAIKNEVVETTDKIENEVVETTDKIENEAKDIASNATETAGNWFHSVWTPIHDYFSSLEMKFIHYFHVFSMVIIIIIILLLAYKFMKVATVVRNFFHSVNPTGPAIPVRNEETAC